MFVLSVKAKKKQLLIGMAAVLLAITLLAVVFSLGKENLPNIPGETNDQRIAFLQQYGWEVEEEPIDVQEIILPKEFNDVYLNYNAVQKTQNMDLLPYAGKTCKQWVYQVTNYPNEENVRATLLVYEGCIIGGDLSSAALNGFLCNFYGDIENGSMNYFTDKTETSSSQSQISEGSSAEPSSSESSSEEGNSTSDENSAAQTDGETQDTAAIPEDAWPTD